MGCSWDEEHGLGVAMHKSRVLEIGGEEVAFMSEAVAKECRTAKSRARGSAAPSDLNFELLNRAVMEGDKPLVKALIAAGRPPVRSQPRGVYHLARPISSANPPSPAASFFCPLSSRNGPPTLLDRVLWPAQVLRSTDSPWRLTA